MKEAEDFYCWDAVNASRMGQYLTKTEQKFIDNYLLSRSSLGKHEIKGLYLDVGGGSGRFSVPLHKRGSKVFTLDIDIVPLRILQRKEKEICVIQADSQNLPLKENVFDCIIGIEIIEYVDPEIFIRECNRVLKDGGLLLFNSSNKKSYKGFTRSLYKRLIRKVLDKAFYRFSYRELKEKLEKNGFLIEDSKGFNWLPVGRNSNSRSIAFYSFLERILKLECFPSISPLVFIKAKRVDK